MNEKNEAVIPFLEMGGAFLLGFAVGMALKKNFQSISCTTWTWLNICLFTSTSSYLDD